MSFVVPAIMSISVSKLTHEWSSLQGVVDLLDKIYMSSTKTLHGVAQHRRP